MLFEYSLLTDKKEVEPLTDFLMDKGAYSVSIEDADAETEREKPIFGEPGIEIDDRSEEHRYSHKVITSLII